MFKRVLIATPPALLFLAIAAAEAYAGHELNHAQLLDRDAR